MKKRKTQTITDKKIASFILIAALSIFQVSPMISLIAYADEASTTGGGTDVSQTSAPESSSSPSSPDTQVPIVDIQTDPVVPPSEPATSTNSTPSLPESLSATTSQDTASTSQGEASTTEGAALSQELNVGTATTTDPDVQATSTEATTTPPVTSDLVDQATPSFSSQSTSTVGTVTVSTTSQDVLDALAASSTLSDIFASSTDMEETGTATGTLPEGTTTIATGDSISLANILNIVNTNLVNSTGSIVMANMVDGYDGDIDLRTSTSSASSSCSLLGCNGVDSITAKIDANANIDNVLAIVASSGGNDVGTVTNGQIFSGDTFAGLNLVNFANTNLIDSKYFVLSLNSFNTINGDIVLPSLYPFFSTSTPGPHIDTLSVNQTADVNNNLDVNANTGGNSVQSLYGETHTGNSVSVTNLYNSINSLLVGGNSVAVYLKVSGNWVGELLGAPAGAAFMQDGNMRMLLFENGTLSTNNALGDATILSTTTAKINNDVQVASDSGNNSIADTENALISTGDSFAAANIVNIANTNVIGRNWVLAIINVFGDLNGNITFGKPDMWLGEQVSANESFIKDATMLTYTITVVNRGDSPASGTHVASTYDATHLDIQSADMEYAESGGVLTFDTGDFQPGESKVITFTAKIKGTFPGTDIKNTATVTSHESDNNLTDNTDSTTITTSTLTISGGGGGGGGGNGGNDVTNGNGSNTTPPTITPNDGGGTSISSLTVSVIRQTASTTIVGPGTKGEQRLVIKNLTSTAIRGVVFDDILYDPAGNELKTETFDLGDILPDEEITVAYDVSFGEKAATGIYGLGSSLHQTGRSSLPYPHNGSIDYSTYGQGGSGGELMNTDTATATPLALIQPPTTPHKVVRKGSVLGAFMENPLGIEVAHAEVAGASQAGKSIFSYSLIYILLFILVALMRMYYKHIRISKA